MNTMKIEKYKKAGDVIEGDVLLTNDAEHKEMVVRGVMQSENEGHVFLAFDDNFTADLPEEAFVLMPNSNAKMYILQPSR